MEEDSRKIKISLRIKILILAVYVDAEVIYYKMLIKKNTYFEKLICYVIFKILMSFMSQYVAFNFNYTEIEQLTEELLS